MVTYKQTLERLELESFCKTFDTSPEEITSTLKEHELSLAHPKSQEQLSREIEQVLGSLEAVPIETDE